MFARIVTCFLALVSPVLRAAPPVFSPYSVEAEITPEDLPGERDARSLLGQRVRLDGNWLAVSETNHAGYNSGTKIHLFHRDPQAGWQWRQAIDIGVTWIGDTGTGYEFDLNQGRLVTANEFGSSGVTFYRPDAHGVWQVDGTLTGIDGRNIYGSPLMMLRGRLLFLPERGEEPCVRILTEGPEPGQWSQEASVPWPLLKSDYWGGFPGIIASDGNRLIMRATYQTQETRARVDILSRATGWGVEASFVNPDRRFPGFPNIDFFGGSVGIEGDRAYILTPGVDALGNPTDYSLLTSFRHVGRRWINGPRNKVSAAANTMVAGNGIVAAYGYLPDWGPPRPGPCLMLNSVLAHRGYVTDGATEISPGTDDRFFAAAKCHVDWEGNPLAQHVRIYRNPFIRKWW